jgi:hypothetical protein
MRAGISARSNHEVAADNSCLIKGCSFTIADGCTALLPNRTIAFESSEGRRGSLLMDADSRPQSGTSTIRHRRMRSVDE